MVNFSRNYLLPFRWTQHQFDRSTWTPPIPSCNYWYMQTSICECQVAIYHQCCPLSATDANTARLKRHTIQVQWKTIEIWLVSGSPQTLLYTRTQASGTNFIVLPSEIYDYQIHHLLRAISYWFVIEYDWGKNRGVIIGGKVSNAEENLLNMIPDSFQRNIS